MTVSSMATDTSGRWDGQVRHDRGRLAEAVGVSELHGARGGEPGRRPLTQPTHPPPPRGYVARRGSGWTHCTRRRHNTAPLIPRNPPQKEARGRGRALSPAPSPLVLPPLSCLLSSLLSPSLCCLCHALPLPPLLPPPPPSSLPAHVPLPRARTSEARHLEAKLW